MNLQYPSVNSATIYLDKNDAYRTHTEDINKDGLFFENVYRQAKICTRIILENTKYRYKQSSGRTDFESDCLFESDCSNKPMVSRYPNNIIAFTAHRGHGKTSAMLSFSQYLKNQNSDTEDEISGQFHVLDVIDPTMLEEKDSIIRTIISQMFRLFRDRYDVMWDKEEPRNFRSVLRESQQNLLKKFRDCYRLAELQKSAKRLSDSYDDLEMLSDHGDSSNLKVKLYELVRDYLEFMFRYQPAGQSKNQPEYQKDSAFLVIQIDDTDMNCKNAFEVVDDIRKYFVIPNVLTLFATDLEQLSISVEKHFLEAYQPILTHIQPNDLASLAAAAHCRKRCRKNAASYLVKLIPGMQRITLPDLDAELRDPLRRILICQDSKETEKTELQQLLINKLNARTLLQLRPHPRGRHPFLPKRMRELSHFLFLLDHMEVPQITVRDILHWSTGTVEATSENWSQVTLLRQNLETLLHYLLNDWSELHLANPRHKMVLEDIHHEETPLKVSTAVASMRKIFQEIQDLIPDREYYTWDDLVRCSDTFRNKHTADDRDFSCALDIYFMIYKMLILIHDCTGYVIREHTENGGAVHE